MYHLPNFPHWLHLKIVQCQNQEIVKALLYNEICCCDTSCRTLVCTLAVSKSSFCRPFFTLIFCSKPITYILQLRELGFKEDD